MEQVEGGDSGISNARLGLEFENTWNSVDPRHYDAKGWCDGSTDDVVKQLHGSQYRLEVIHPDVPPFLGMARERCQKNHRLTVHIGDLKIMIVPHGSDNVGLLRLRDANGEGSLWRLRCREAYLRDEVKGLLAGEE
jgi:AP-4 complex subunit epsilon-1